MSKIQLKKLLIRSPILILIFFSLFFLIFNVFLFTQEEVILYYTVKSLITKKDTTDLQKLERVIDFINKNIYFNEGKKGFFRANPMEILNKETGGQCGEFSRITIVLLSKLRIPSHRIYLFTFNKQGKLYSNHVMVEALIDNNWILVDPMYKMIFFDPESCKFYNSSVKDPELYRKIVDTFPGISLNRCNAPNVFIYSYPIDYDNFSNNSLVHWQKFPAGKSIHYLFRIFFPKREDDISMPLVFERPYLLKIIFYFVLFLILSAVYLELLSREKKVF